MQITNVKRDGRGVIREYKLDDGRIIDTDQAVDMVESGELQGYDIAVAKNGKKSIKSKPDATEENNLRNLPNF